MATTKMTGSIDLSAVEEIPYTRGVGEWIVNCCTMATRYLDLTDTDNPPGWVITGSHIPIRFCPWCRKAMMLPPSRT